MGFDAGAMPITSRLLVRSTIALLAVGFLALLGMMAMTIWLGERAQVQFDDVINARDARSSASDIRNALQTAESSQRGFLVTGNEIYLAPFDASRILARRQLEATKQVLLPSRDAELALQRLTTIIADKFSEMDETIALKRDRRDSEVLAVVRSNRGKALMDEANVFLAGIILAAEDRLTKGAGDLKGNSTWLRWMAIASGLVIIFVVGVVTVTVVRYTRQLAAARSEVSVLNQGLETRVRERTADLIQANDEIQRFAYIVTHDLRAPLVNIMGFVSELEGSVRSLQGLVDRSAAAMGSTDPLVQEAHIAATMDAPEAIGFIRSSTKKMDDLINAILKISREGRRTLRPEAVDLGDMVKSVAAAIQHQLAEADGEIDLDLAVPSISTDRLSLEQILGNLFDNAVKYRAKERPLRIEVRAHPVPGDRVAIEISDNGRGIAEQDLERIFELFRRSGVQDQPGEGIGLAQVRTVVRYLGGDITVTSALGKGTTFRLLLPRKFEFSWSFAA
jgi:signal transduction histidine kinase